MPYRDGEPQARGPQAPEAQSLPSQEAAAKADADLWVALIYFGACICIYNPMKNL